MGRFTTVEDIENLLQIDIKVSTKPSIAQVEDYIRQVDAQIDSRRLSLHSSDVLMKIDVIDATTLVKDSIKWVQDGMPSTGGVVVVPPLTPIIDVCSGTLSMNSADISQAASWTLLVEGGGDSTDFIVLRKRAKNNKYLGYALYFYSSNAPAGGYQRLRGTWTYGYNIDEHILNEWATLKASEKVINARLFSGQPMNVASYTGGSMNTYVNTEYENQIAYIRERCREIEERYFPSDPIAVAVM